MSRDCTHYEKRDRFTLIAVKSLWEIGTLRFTSWSKLLQIKFISVCCLATQLNNPRCHISQAYWRFLFCDDGRWSCFRDFDWLIRKSIRSSCKSNAFHWSLVLCASDDTGTSIDTCPVMLQANCIWGYHSSIGYLVDFSKGMNNRRIHGVQRASVQTNTCWFIFSCLNVRTGDDHCTSDYVER